MDKLLKINFEVKKRKPCSGELSGTAHCLTSKIKDLLL